MTQSDDKRRGVNVREASRLRATLGSEPSSGYAFHDEVRVERTRAPRSDSGPPQLASHAPRERSFARTLVGAISIQEALKAPEFPKSPVENDANDGAQPASWPPLPQVPQELHGAVQDDEAKVEALQDLAPVTGTKKPSSAPPELLGGAIWQAVPSVVSTPPVELATLPSASSPPGSMPPAPPVSAPPPRPSQPAEGARRSQEPARNSAPLGHLAMLSELEAEQLGGYGDKRLLRYEAMVERNAWEQLNEELAREPQLSPALRLLSVVARRETLPGDQKDATARLTQEAIATIAQLLQVPEASPTALVIGKRLLRKNPVWTQKRPASASLSIGIMLAGIAAGAGFGWLVTVLLL